MKGGGIVRKTLELFYGKIVTIHGIYDGPAKGHERSEIIFDKTLKDYPQYRGNIMRSEQHDKYHGIISPISFPEKTSCITHVRGMNDFSTISEEHLNIMEDLGSLYGIEKGSEISLCGEVAKYRKGTGEDYCLINVERCFDK